MPSRTPATVAVASRNAISDHSSGIPASRSSAHALKKRRGVCFRSAPSCGGSPHRCRGRLFENERDLHRHAVLADLALLDFALLRNHLEASDAPQCFGGALHALVHCLLKAFGRGGGDLAHACDGHDLLLLIAAPSVRRRT